MKTIVFDAVGTLIRPAVPVHDTYREIAAGHGIELPVTEIQRRFSAAYGRFGSRTYAELNSTVGLSETAPDFGLAERLRWRSIVLEVFAECDDATVIFESLWNYYADPENWSVYRDVEPTWDALRRRGLQVVIASNFDERLRNICNSSPVLSRHDHLFVSSEIGFVKPQLDFYRHIMRRLDRLPDQLLMIGDHEINDVGAPKQLDWSAVHLRRDASCLAGQISSLDQLIDFLDV